MQKEQDKLPRTRSESETTFVHLRARNNGVASERGGYTVAIKPRSNGMFSVSICQCNTNQRYDEKLGEKIAESRLSRGQFFVQPKADLVATLETLHNKLCIGMVPRLNLDALNTGSQLKAAA